MKKFLIFIFCTILSFNAFAQTDTTDFEVLDSVSVVSFYRNSVNVGSLMKIENLVLENHGQEPSHLFKKMPNIFSMNDNGTDFGYGYFRIRGLDQTRINATLDGMPWNEAEDYGVYFANSPDLLSSLQSVKVERGTSANSNGVAASGGSISLESIDLKANNPSYIYLGGGSFYSNKQSIVYNSGVVGHSAFHVKATHQQTNGYKDYGFNKSDAFTLKYGYFFNNYTSIDFMTINGHHRNGQGWIGNTMEELTHNPKSNGNVKEDEDDWFQSINKINFKTWFSENIVFNASAYLQYQTGWYNMDLDNYMTRMETSSWENTGMVYSYGLTHYLYGTNITVSKYSDYMTFIAGITYYRYQREHYMDDRVSTHFVNIPVEEYYNNFGYKNDNEFFISTTFNLDKFKIGVNGQYRYVGFAYRDILANINYSAEQFGTEWNFINYGINAEYNPDNSNKFYIRYAEASREPTRSDMFGGNEFYIGELTTTNAERSYDVEAGYVTVRDNVEANLNFYYMGFKNERILTGEYGENGLPMHESVDNSYRTGVELSLDWNFAGGFHYTFNASCSENIVRFIDKRPYGDDYISFNVMANHILTPAFTFNNDVYYKKNGLRFGVNNTYHSKMYYSLTHQTIKDEIPYYLTFNAYGNYKFENWEVGLYVNNLFNRVNYFNAAEGADGQILWFRDSGRNFFVDLKFYF